MWRRCRRGKELRLSDGYILAVREGKEPGVRLFTWFAPHIGWLPWEVAPKEQVDEWMFSMILRHHDFIGGEDE